MIRIAVAVASFLALVAPSAAVAADPATTYPTQTPYQADSIVAHSPTFDTRLGTATIGATLGPAPTGDPISGAAVSLALCVKNGPYGSTCWLPCGHGLKTGLDGRVRCTLSARALNGWEYVEARHVKSNGGVLEDTAPILWFRG